MDGWGLLPNFQKSTLFASLILLISEPIRVDVFSFVIYKGGNLQYPEQEHRTAIVKKPKSLELCQHYARLDFAVCGENHAQSS